MTAPARERVAWSTYTPPERARAFSPAFPLQLAVWLAVTVGAAELAVKMVEHFWLDRPIRLGAHAVWMTPLSYLLWFGPLGIALALALRVRRGRVPAELVVGAPLFLAWLSLALLHPKIHPGASVLLAAGLAMQSARPLAARTERLERAVRRGLPWLVAGALAAIGAFLGGRAARERMGLAALPAARAGAPNVLLIILDTVRGASTSVHGYARRTTPQLERWAAQGARYDLAFATAPWTLPSHASVFTGRWPHELTSSLRTPLDGTYPTLAEALRESGYATGAFAANLSYVTWQYGLARGFLRFEDFPVTPRALIVSSVLGRKVHDRGIVRRRIGFYDETDRKPAGTIDAAFLRWLDRLDRREERRPWFAFLNYFDAHHPYLPPAPFDTLFGPKPRPRFRLGELKYEGTTAEEIARQRNAYDGAIAYQDREIDSLLRELARRGVLDNTLVVVTSDHGEHWGEHQRLSHGNSMYRQLLEVPLVIRYPARFPAGSVVREPVSLRDLPATVLDAAGIANRWGFPGGSLADYLRPGAAPRPVLSTNATLGAPEEASLVADGLHYVLRSRGPEELYDLARDPADSLDLAATPRGRAALPRFRALLDSLGHPIPRTAELR